MDNTLNILANAGDAVCAVNDEKQVVYWNTAAEKMLNISASEAANQPCWELIQGKTLEGKPFCGPDCPIYAKLSRREPIPHFDMWVTDKNGKPILTNFSTITIPRQNDRRQPDQAVVIHLMRAVDNPALYPNRLRVYLLGPLVVQQADGRKIAGKFWRRANVRELFVYLLRQRGNPTARETITQALWPDLDHSSALHCLNTAVYNLRRSLEPELHQGIESNYVFYEAGCYWLGGSQPYWIDLDEFHMGIKQARLETAVDKAIHLYEETLALYRGDYLADLPNTDNIAEQTRQRHLYLSALEELGNLYQQQERGEKAREKYLQILAIDPYRESTCQLLTQLSLQPSSWSDSLAYCQRLAAALKSELDLILGNQK